MIILQALMIYLFLQTSASEKVTHTLQKRVGCAFENGRKTYFWQHMYNQKDVYHYSYEKQHYVADHPSLKEIIEDKNRNPSYLKNRGDTLSEICNAVKNIFDELPTELGSIEKSSVTVSMETKGSEKYLVCFVHGFHPNNINVTWLRDGEELFYGVTSSGILPLRDGTFQIKKYLPITDNVEQSHACRIEHESLMESILVPWDPAAMTNIWEKLEKLFGIPALIVSITFPLVAYFCKRTFPKADQMEAYSTSSSSSDNNLQAVPLNLTENMD
ncbi:class II histocompatibility antigen, B-L beta chain-like isoform X2 [Protopterus annectens]|uniref:class II histocompatibility antigen, B-L beta chain-like isoform X2 n=1 Tax=Protopterus annectens TaxID=7888 RepID=UPI001CF9F301|nr:class II histocompatibility antigen, B-L beta chain-like isoform X2 [Protopterus annectens]